MEGTVSPPTGPVLSLIGALSNTTNHSLHLQAIQARDQALSASSDSYNHLCLQLLNVLIGSDQHDHLLSRMNPIDLTSWQQTDPESVIRLQQDPRLWIPFGQMAGYILKNALLRPPIGLFLQGVHAFQAQQLLLLALSLQHPELRAVASSIIATCAVYLPPPNENTVPSGNVQPALHLRNWKTLIPALVSNVSVGSKTPGAAVVEGSLITIRKILEDGPAQLDQEELDLIIPVLLDYLAPLHPERYKLTALQSIAAVLNHEIMPSSLVLHFDRYLAGLSLLAATTTSTASDATLTPSNNTPAVRQWVCRNIVTLLAHRPEFIRPHFPSISVFMLSSTSLFNHEPEVALEACEFWLTLAHLDDDACSADMSDVMIHSILPTLVPTLVQCMVYSADQQEELLMQNDIEATQHTNTNRPSTSDHRSNGY